MKRMTAALIASVFVLAACSGGHEGHGAGGTGSFGEAGDPGSADREIEISTTEAVRFDPESVDVEQGETITFVVTNDTTVQHEFILGDAEYHETHEMAAGEEHEEPNGTSLDPGTTEEVTWTFTEAGEVIYGCHVSGHYEAGMRGVVNVE